MNTIWNVICVYFTRRAVHCKKFKQIYWLDTTDFWFTFSAYQKICCYVGSVAGWDDKILDWDEW
jgi:hypothetical protein